MVVAERQPAAVAAGGPTHEDEESIDDYMARLMNRIRGNSGAEERAAPAPKIESRPTIDLPTAVVAEIVRPDSTPDHEPAVVEPPVIPAGPVQLVARSAPPESGVNLRAMRELANMTARGAIDKHAQGRWGKASIRKLVGGAVALVGGIGLMVGASYLTDQGVWVRAPALIAMVAGIYWIAESAALSRNVRLLGGRATRFVKAESQPVPVESSTTEAGE